MVHDDFITWFKENVEPKLLNKYDVKYVFDEKGDFGELRGVQLDSELRGGHIYVWSSGFYNYHLYDFGNDDDLVPDIHGNYKGEGFDKLLEVWLSKLEL